MHRSLFVKSCCLAVLISLSLSWPSAGKPPWQLISFRRVEADPNKVYELTEESGPWLIFASSFAGEGAAPGSPRPLVQQRRLCLGK